MALSVKNKIWLGTTFLFLLLLLTGGVGIYYTAQLKDQAKAVLKDNYESLADAYAMQRQLDSFVVNQQTLLTTFDSALAMQERNITEPGERAPTHSIRRDFEKLKAGDTTISVFRQIRSNIGEIVSANMDAISIKSQKAEQTAKTAFMYIIGLAGILFLIAFTFMVNFPSIITSPITAFTVAIKEISAKNYKHRIHLNRKDEFGQMADAFNEMAKKLQYYESSNLNRLMFEKSRAEAVINSLKDASIGIDKENRVLFANTEALQLINLKAIDIVGKTVDEAVGKSDLLRFLFTNNDKSPFTIVVDNKENYFMKEVIEVGHGETESKVIVIKNITSFKELDAAKTNFIATISHELKTPLASSDFCIKLLENAKTGELNREQKELVEQVKQDNQRILKILSELLNMTQVEAGKIQLDTQKVPIATIIGNAIETVASTARQKNITVKTILQTSTREIEADPDKTTWVLNNFLTNAIKYSPESTEVVVEITRSNGNITFSVKDDGPGISPEYHRRLFERYFQVPGSKFKGSGLGLAISKDFIEAQGGKIWVESAIGQGSKFCFSLPAIV